jgi:hypothetical protein
MSPSTRAASDEEAAREEVRDGLVMGLVTGSSGARGL